MGESQREEWARASFSSGSSRRGISIRAAGVSPPSGHQSLSLLPQTSLARFPTSVSPSSSDECRPLPPPSSLLVVRAYETPSVWWGLMPDWFSDAGEFISDRHQGAPDRARESAGEQLMIGSDGYVGCGSWGELIISDGPHGAVHLPGCIRINVICCSLTMMCHPKERSKNRSHLHAWASGGSRLNPGLTCRVTSLLQSSLSGTRR